MTPGRTFARRVVKKVEPVVANAPAVVVSQPKINIALRAQTTFRKNQGRVNILTDYTIFVGDKVLSVGTVGGKSTSDQLLSEFKRNRGRFKNVNQDVLTLATELKLL